MAEPWTIWPRSYDMNEIRQAAERVVNHLLDERDFSSPEEFAQRPGGKEDPYRQTTVKVTIPKGKYKGKRTKLSKGVAPSPGAVTGSKHPGEKEEEEPAEKAKSRFDLKFECGSRAGTAAKAWKKGKRSSGKSVAGKPGKVSYREALIATVLENIRKKKAAKGKAVAKAPGSVRYRKEGLHEAIETFEQFWNVAREEALQDPNDAEYLQVLQYYLEIADPPVTAFKGLKPAQFVDRLRRMPAQDWAALARSVGQLRQSWEADQGQGAAQNAPAPEEGAPEGNPDDEPTAPERDRPPHMESVKLANRILAHTSQPLKCK